MRPSPTRGQAQRRPGFLPSLFVLPTSKNPGRRCACPRVGRCFAFYADVPYFAPRMKVGLVILHADPRKGGAEGYTVNLARALIARGHDVSLLATTFGPQADGIPQVLLDGRGITRLGRYRSFLNCLDRHLDSTRYDVVHAIAPVRRCDFYHPQAGLAAEALASGHLKYEGLRAPLDKLATRLNRKRQFVGSVERSLLEGPNAPTVLCVSDMVRRTAREHFPSLPEEKTVTLFNAVDPDRFDPAARPEAGKEVRLRFGIGDEKVVALVVAQDFKRKGVRPAVEALARVKDERLVLLVVGKPDARPYQELAERLGVARRVIFAGPTNDTYGSYQAGDFFVLPTWHDPCSLVVLEALAMGLPTITTVQNGACEIIDEGRHGYVLNDPADVEGIARGMAQILDPAVREAQRAACLALRPRLSYERHLDQLESLYRARS
jgi:UDP-glucose:(heptosyl)LPS alpha-1,3-glucosyltransferase